MKRSDMVAVIAIELMTRLPEWEKQERINFASEILQAIEIEGMLPPEIPVIVDNGEEEINDDLKTIKVFNLESVNKWEPEIPPCESCEKNGQPNCGNSHCVTRNIDK